MNQQKTRNLALMSLFIAIEILMVMVPFLGFIPIGPLRATTLHIPVIIAGIVLGKKARSANWSGIWFIQFDYQYHSTNDNIFCLFSFYQRLIMESCYCDYAKSMYWIYCRSDL